MNDKHECMYIVKKRKELDMMDKHELNNLLRHYGEILTNNNFLDCVNTEEYDCVRITSYKYNGRIFQSYVRNGYVIYCIELK